MLDPLGLELQEFTHGKEEKTEFRKSFTLLL
jgi:hypothetical protein